MRKYCRMEQETQGESYTLGGGSKEKKEEKRKTSHASLNEHRNS